MQYYYSYISHRSGNLLIHDRDENVNGRHGAFSRSQHACTSSNVSRVIPVYSDNPLHPPLTMAAFRDQRPHSSLNTIRERRLELVRRMEEKIKKSQAKIPKKMESIEKNAQAIASKKTENTLSIFVLDITKVLDDYSASWIPFKQDNYSGPDERILYSLVAGKGELIVFGGIRRQQMTIHKNSLNDEVYNDLHFISPPRYDI